MKDKSTHNLETGKEQREIEPKILTVSSHKARQNWRADGSTKLIRFSVSVQQKV